MKLSYMKKRKHIGRKNIYIPPPLRLQNIIYNDIKQNPINNEEIEQLKNMIIKPKRRKCCGGIIFNIDQKRKIIYILVVLGRLSKKWGLPKGGIERNETYEKCAIREIKEETGLDYTECDLKERIKIHSTYYYMILKKSKKIGSGPIDKREIAKIKWIPINYIKELNKYDKVNRELRDLLKKIKKKIKKYVSDDIYIKFLNNFN